MKFKDILSEFFASFQFFFLGTGAYMYYQYNSDFGPLAVSLILGASSYIGVMIFSNTKVGHMNPLVSIFAYLFGKVTFSNAVRLIIIQLIASICASLLLSTFVSDSNAASGILQPQSGHFASWMVEFLGSIILVYGVYLTFNSSYPVFGILLSFLLIPFGWFAVPITGAAFNPARAFGPAFLAGDFTFFWLYLTSAFSAVLSVWAIKLVLDKIRLYRLN